MKKLLADGNVSMRSIILWAHFTCQFNLSFLLSNKIDYALKRIFVDSQVSKYLKLERRKIRNTLLNVLIPVKRDEVS